MQGEFLRCYYNNLPIEMEMERREQVQEVFKKCDG